MEVVSFLIASILLTVSPGPDILYVFSLSLSQGKKAGVLLATGLVSGILVHTSLVAFGVAFFIKTTPWVWWSIKLFGVFYLLRLCWLVYQAPVSIQWETNELKQEKSLFWRGFWMNVLNPKVTLFFLVFFPTFLSQNKAGDYQSYYFLGFLFMLQAWLIFYLVSHLAAQLQKTLLSSSKSTAIGLFFKYLQITLFLVFVLMLLWDR
ncbi:MAG: LysE family translocator [Flavobacteriales bacterium]|nr:LysE family translocator [Flavobacteriales bacterium]